MEMNVQGAISGEGDASDTSIDFTMGGSFDKGNVVFGVQYSDRGLRSKLTVISRTVQSPNQLMMMVQSNYIVQVLHILKVVISGARRLT